MNDFSDIEAQLKAIRPAPLRDDFVARIERAMENPADLPGSDNIVRPHQFRRQWLIGLSLAAAAALLVLVRANFQPPRTSARIASASPKPSAGASQALPTPITNGFVPAGSTQVVYHKRDEGLLFAQNREEPMRRVRSVTQETLQWKNPATGASLRVSYPSEQVELIPISAQ